MRYWLAHCFFLISILFAPGAVAQGDNGFDRYIPISDFEQDICEISDQVGGMGIETLSETDATAISNIKSYCSFNSKTCVAQSSYSIEEPSLKNTYKANTCLLENSMAISFESKTRRIVLTGYEKNYFDNQKVFDVCGPLILIVMQTSSPKPIYYYEYYDSHWAAYLLKQGKSHTIPSMGERCDLENVSVVDEAK